MKILTLHHVEYVYGPLYWQTFTHRLNILQYKYLLTGTIMISDEIPIHEVVPATNYAVVSNPLPVEELQTEKLKSPYSHYNARLL
jgi:hypothetical protein